MRTRRVGTVTLGLSLITFGSVFLLRMLIPSIDYWLILRFWPVILIFLGAEILIANFHHKEDSEEKFVYDFASILIIILLFAFSIGMAGVEWIMEHAEMYYL